MNHHAMIPKILILTFLLAVAAAAQSPVTVFEEASTVIAEKDYLAVKLAFINSAPTFNANVRLEILDPDDHIYASKDIVRKVERGRNELKENIQIDPNAEIDDLIWKRLRRTIAAANGGTVATNLISLSQIMPDMFELQISGPENIYAGMSFPVRVLALNPVTEKTISNVELKSELVLQTAQGDKRTITSSGRTNGDGFAALVFEIPPEIRLARYEHDLKVVGKKNVFEREANESFYSNYGSFVYLHTDKPLYQPSQKFHARGLYLDPAKRPLADRDLKFEIENYEGETIYSGEAKTSRFGVITIDWDIPDNAGTGRYLLNISNDEDSRVGYSDFRVSRYELPTFAVNARAAKPFYLIDEKTAEVTVNASYLFGKPVERGRVRITRDTSEYEFRKMVEAAETEAEGETDARGIFSGTVDLSEARNYLDKYEDKMYRDLLFTASFTDPTTNRTQQKRFAVRISREQINVRMIRQPADPNPEVPYLFYITTFYPDGTPAKCDVRIEGNYRDTNLVTKLGDSQTNSYGAAKFELRMPPKPFPEANPEMDLRIIADDRKGNTGGFAKRLNVSESNGQIWFKTDKTIYFPNEPIRLNLVASEMDGPVFIDIVKNGSVLYSKSLRTENGRAGVLIPYREAFAGELNLYVYNFDDDRDTRFTKTIIYPDRSRLNLKINGLKGTYRPNEEAQISLSAAREDGETAESAIGFFVIDRAIEERAAADRLPDNLSLIRMLAGNVARFGELTRRDLDRIDPAQPVSEDLQLAAELLLELRSNERRTVKTVPDYVRFSKLYDDALEKRVAPLRKLLTESFEKKFTMPMNESELREFAIANSFDLGTLRDSWETPFRYSFRIDREFSVLEFKSAGADKVFSTADDLSTRVTRFEWFRARQERLNTILNNHLQSGGQKPLTIESLKAVWKAAGIDFDDLRDLSGRPLMIEPTAYERDFLKVAFETIANLDGEYQQEMRSQLVHQKVVTFRVSGVGVDDKPRTSDDVTLAAFTVVEAEKSLEAERLETLITKQPISGKAGLLRGVLIDRNEAVIAGAEIEIENQLTNDKKTLRSNESGEFRMPFLIPGKYRISARAPGFATSVLQNIVVSPGNSVWLRIFLDVGSVTSTVDITADGGFIVNGTNSQLHTSISVSPARPDLVIGDGTKRAFTPRVREYFPETLVWQPDIVTDKNGRAVLNFKLGDNLTSWKLYAVGSTEKGEFALAEKEFQTFQPFFAELDPPRFLTVGDRISLPVPIRNYTAEKQKVSVSLAPNEWSHQSGGARSLEVPANSSANAIFDFQATAAIAEGKQKVTAVAKKDGDAIEKPVTVRPNGKEIVTTRTDMFDDETSFEVGFPANALSGSRSAEIRIYPNMLAHIAESASGLLQRPYGCGEQTTSSTYTNLMILKIDRDLGQTIDPVLKNRANAFVDDGYKRLLNYQTKSGGFSFWGPNDIPKAALTAYVLRFLSDADSFIEVDKDVVRRASEWLMKQQDSDGRWEKNDLTTAFVLRALSEVDIADSSASERLRQSLSRFRPTAEKSDNMAVLANLALAARKSGDEGFAQILVARLRERIATEDPTVADAETPFYGWGAVARVETAALVVQVIVGEIDKGSSTTFGKDREFVKKALRFILSNKDRFGVWSSTQTTVNVLDALIITNRADTADVPSKVEIIVNGKPAGVVNLVSKGLNLPVTVDLLPFLDSAENRVEIRAKGRLELNTAHLVTRHYIDWRDAKPESDEFELNLQYDRTEARMGEDIQCRVSGRRLTSRNGMLLMEIGLPPGADVDRTSLETAKDRREFSSYEIHPDRIVVYTWRNDKIDFNFKFRPRFRMNAQSAPSRIYDYYNDAASMTVAPVRFEVK